ncbi:MAG: YdcF family protein [Pseudomonadota bacterium]
MPEWTFVVPKLLAFLIRPDVWLWLGILTVGSALLFRFHKLAGWVTASLVVAVTLVAFVPVGTVWLGPLETRFPTYPDIDNPAAIIILGGGEASGPHDAWDTLSLNEAGDRIVEGIALAKGHEDALLIFTGGTGSIRPDATRSNSAQVAQDVIEAMGVEQERTLIGPQARTTEEHPTEVRALLESAGGPSGPIVIVTSAFHMPRSIGVFCQAGFQNVIPYPVDHRTTPNLSFFDKLGWDYAGNLAQLQNGIREWVALVTYHWRGRTNALFPSGC